MVSYWPRGGAHDRIAAHFEQVAEVTLDEPRIELVYPLDAAAERFFRAPRRIHTNPEPGSLLSGEAVEQQLLKSTKLRSSPQKGRA